MPEIPESATTTRRFEYLPVALFGSVMGVTGLGLAWRLAQVRYGMPAWIAQSLTVLAVLGFLAMSFAYALKLLTALGAVRNEWGHPIAVNTFATAWVSMLLLPMLLAETSLSTARILWAIGALGNVTFGIYVVGRWMRAQHQFEHVAPAWILPVIGLLDMPLAVPSLALPHAQDVMVVGLACGLFFVTPVFTIVFSRLVFASPLPAALEPSLLILVAPFALGVSCYVATTGAMDLFARALFALMVFMLIVLLGRLRHLGQCCPFRVAWWSVSFPLAACAIAALRFAQAEPGLVSDGIALVLLALATIVILWLLGRTLSGIARGELRALST